jgi:hypothetical protein
MSNAKCAPPPAAARSALASAWTSPFSATGETRDAPGACHRFQRRRVPARSDHPARTHRYTK